MPTPEDNTYLWDGSGEPDAEVARLEQILGRYRQTAPLGPLPRLERAPRWQVLLWSRAFRVSMAGAAAVLALALVCPWAIRRVAYPHDSCGAFCVAGAPRINGEAVKTSADFRAGGLVETDSASEAEIRVGLVGRVTVMPNSRMRLVEMRRGRYRMALEHGKISAHTLAPPFTFVVDTPGPTAYDVGCAFTLETDEHGSGLLRVTSGWVQLELDDRQILIPAGAASLMRPGGNLGTPYFEDAPAAFREALERYDFGPQDGAGRDAALEALVAAARPRDVFSFVEMLRTAAGEGRRRLIDRGMALVPPPSNVTRAGLLRGDDVMMAAWRRQLGIGEPKRWWVNWRDILQ